MRRPSSAREEVIYSRGSVHDCEYKKLNVAKTNTGFSLDDQRNCHVPLPAVQEYYLHRSIIITSSAHVVA